MDNEVKGEGNSLNFKFRMYDSRLNRFFAVDPLSSEYPHYTPYSFSGNKLIAFRELEGLEQRYFMIYLDEDGDGNSCIELIKETDNPLLPDGNIVGVFDLGVSYSFNKKMNVFGIWETQYANKYSDYEEFVNDPAEAIRSGKFETNEDITKEGAIDLLELYLLRKITKSSRNPNRKSLPAKTQKQNLKRLPQDAKLGPGKKAPVAKPTRGRTIGKNDNQNADMQKRVADLKEKGATDIRVDQQQVNAQGEHVGINRPDLQYTLDGKRHYVEWDTRSSGRGPGHESRIRANDPDAASVELIIMD